MCFPQPRIAIVGGGPGGLTTALLLHKRGISSTIFELRQKPTIEEITQPSGMLDLHQETGLEAIKKCDLLDDFLPLTGDCAELMRIADKDGTAVFEHGGGGEDRPEISRNALSHLLLSELPPEMVKWGHKLLSAKSSTKFGLSEFELDFGSDGKYVFDLVIGADGAWSRVRNLLTDVKPQYSGRHVLTLTIRDITQKYPHLADLVGPGTFFALGNRHGISAQRGSLDSERIYIFITTPDEHFDTTSVFANLTAGEAKTHLLDDDTFLGQWGPKTKELVTAACLEKSNSKLDIRPICGLPVGHTWEHKSGVTVIGDAAHVMPPSGEGVNIAMWDAVQLSEAIIEAYTFSANPASFQKVLDPLMEKVEGEMAARAKEEAEQSRVLHEKLFSEDGVNDVIEMFKSFGPPPE